MINSVDQVFMYLLAICIIWLLWKNVYSDFMPIFKLCCLGFLLLNCISFWNIFWTCVLSQFSHVWLFASPWTVACQAPLSVAFSRQEYWSGWPCPSPGDFPDLGIEPKSLVSPSLTGWFFTISTIWEAPLDINPLLDIWFTYFLLFSRLPSHFVSGFLCYVETFGLRQ